MAKVTLVIRLVTFLALCTSLQSAPASEIIDLGYGLDENSQYWPGTQRYNITLKTTFRNVTGIPWYAANTYEASEHVGTHLDAPFHFSEFGWKVGEIPLQRFFVPGVLIDVSDRVAGNDFELTPEDITTWESENGPIPNGSVILIRFGWSSLHYDNRTAYLGFGTSNSSELNFPGLSNEAAQYIRTKDVYGVGLDTPSIDPGKNVIFEAHQTLSGAQIFGIENMKLEKDVLPATGFRLHIMPSKITHGTGAPCRVMAFLDNNWCSDTASSGIMS